MRAIAITSLTPSRALPNVPTFGSTVPGFVGDAWVGLLAPAGTPSAIVNKINAEVRKIGSSPDFSDKLSSQGANAFTTTPGEFSDLIKADLVKWSALVKSIGATVD